MNDTPDVHVVGGGLAGLVAARTLHAAGLTCLVHDAAGTPGGRARTDLVGSHRFNRGPHALYVGGPGAAILASLGVRPRGAPPRVKGTLMVRDGRAVPAPVSAASLLRTPLLGWRGRRDLGRLLASISGLDPAAHAGLTTSAWVDAQTDDPAAAAVLHTLLRLVTYVDEPDALSADVAVAQLQLGLGRGVQYLHGGWQQVVDALLTPTTRFATTSRVTELPDAPAVIVAAGGPAAAEALLGVAFGGGPSADAAVVDLALSRPARHRVVLGVDQSIYLSDHGFPEHMSPDGEGSVSVAQYLGSGGVPDRAALRDFARHAGVAEEHVVDERYLHRMTVVSRIATADSGGLAGRQGVRIDDRPGVFLAGDWIGSEGHLLDAVVCSAHAAALAAVAHLEHRSVSR